MKLEDAQAIVDFVVREAPSPVSVFVADTHGELVAAATSSPCVSAMKTETGPGASRTTKAKIACAASSFTK